MEEQKLFRPANSLDPEELEILRTQHAGSRRGLSGSGKAVRRPWNMFFSPPFLVLSGVVLLVILAEVLYTGDPGYMVLEERSLAPSAAHLFGTDSLGRDVFGMVLFGGRISLATALLATLVSTGTAVLFGALAALSPRGVASLLNRLMELLLSVPSILLMIFLQGIWGEGSLLSISLSIGLSSWMTLAKMVTIQIERMKGEDYVQLAQYQGAELFYLLRRHFLPELLPVLLHMSLSGAAHAMAAETTLSFLGIGFPVDTLTWGSLLSLSSQALLTKAWWIILFPGMFLVLTVTSLVEIGEKFRKKNSTTKTL